MRRYGFLKIPSEVQQPKDKKLRKSALPNYHSAEDVSNDVRVPSFHYDVVALDPVPLTPSSMLPNPPSG
jgi:hypothetical protein